MVTPVLVQWSGWGQLGFNMLGLAVVGAALESRLARATWALAYLIGGVGSIALGSVWHPDAGGGGSSDAVPALIGALAVLARRRPRPPARCPVGAGPGLLGVPRPPARPSPRPVVSTAS
jgi:membrane associated rhomboid family serine protease